MKHGRRVAQRIGRAGAGRLGPRHGRTRLHPEADRLLAQTVKRGAGWVAIMAVVSVAGAAAETLLPAALGSAVDRTVHGSGAVGAVAVCILLVVVLVSSDGVDELARGMSRAASTARLRHLLLNHLVAVGPRATQRLRAGDIVSRLVGNAADAGTAPGALVLVATAVLTPAASLVALLLIDPWLALTFVAGLPLIALFLRVFVRDTSSVVAGYLNTQGAITSRLLDALAGARTIAAAGTVNRETERVLTPLPALREQGFAMWRTQARAAAQGALLAPLLQVAVLAVAGVQLAAGAISPGKLLAATQYTMLAAGLGSVVSALNGLARARAGASRAAEMLVDRPPAYGTTALPAGSGRVEFRGVTVWHGRTRVLDGLDLVLPGGRAVAIVGCSGSGKSVLAALVGRLIDPDAGEVLLDGVPVRSLDRYVLRREVGYAFERPVLVGETIGDAIAFGAPALGGEQMCEAAHAACADTFIRRLPHGYRTPLSEAPMSGGEIQRIGLARAFAHPGRLLVLDDATSSLDSVTELQVSHALTDRFQDLTRMIVAHRVGTAARADLVVWLDRGRVRAYGPHRALWEHPDYRSVFQPDPPSAGERAALAVGGAA